MNQINKSHEFTYETTIVKTAMAFICAALIGGIVTIVMGLVFTKAGHSSRAFSFGELFSVWAVFSDGWLAGLVVFGGPVWIVLYVMKIRSYAYYCGMGAIVPMVVAFAFLYPLDIDPNNSLYVPLNATIIICLILGLMGVILGFIMWRIAFKKVVN